MSLTQRSCPKTVDWKTTTLSLQPSVALPFESGLDGPAAAFAANATSNSDRAAVNRAGRAERRLDA